MRKRVLSLCMALALCLALLPIPVSAGEIAEDLLASASDDVEIEATEVAEVNPHLEGSAEIGDAVANPADAMDNEEVTAESEMELAQLAAIEEAWAYLQANGGRFTGSWDAWNKNYAQDSDLGKYVANIACAQDGKTGSTLQYNTHWCAMFVMDCAQLAGATTAIPTEQSSAWTPTFYENLIKAGATVVSRSNARAGDIAFVNWSGRTGINNIEHVEIVYDNHDGIVYTVGGNTGSTGSYRTNYVNKRTTPGSAASVQGNLTHIVRPNYGSGAHGHHEIQKGATDATCVRELQTKLNKVLQAGLNKVIDLTLEVDGDFGNNTETVLKKYQELRGLEPDGVCGEQTWAALETDYNSNQAFAPTIRGPELRHSVSGNIISFTWGSVSNADQYDLEIHVDRGSNLSTDDPMQDKLYLTTTECTVDNLPAGNYWAWVAGYNRTFENWNFGNKVTFTVSAPVSYNVSFSPASLSLKVHRR